MIQSKFDMSKTYLNRPTIQILGMGPVLQIKNRSVFNFSCPKFRLGMTQCLFRICPPEHHQPNSQLFLTLFPKFQNHKFQKIHCHLKRFLPQNNSLTENTLTLLEMKFHSQIRLISRFVQFSHH